MLAKEPARSFCHQVFANKLVTTARFSLFYCIFLLTHAAERRAQKPSAFHAENELKDGRGTYKREQAALEPGFRSCTQEAGRGIRVHARLARPASDSVRHSGNFVGIRDYS